MDQEKIGKLIKDIRKKNNLTQQQFAEKYGVTYQAVSKWENAKNIPDFSILKKISEDYNISLDDILNGENKESKKFDRKKYLFILVPILLILLSIIIIILFNNNKDFEFKTISSSCKDFTISGSLAYNNSKSSIYITNIQYCGKSEDKKYKEIKCSLYEVNNDKQLKISSFDYKDDKEISLDEFLKQVTFTIDKYDRICKNYNENSLLLVIKATYDDKTINYDVPLSIDKSCK